MYYFLPFLKKIYRKFSFSNETKAFHKKLIKKILPSLFFSNQRNSISGRDIFDQKHTLKEERGVIWGILTPPHTITLAQTLAQQLQRHNITVNVLVGEQEEFLYDWYIVLCPQIFTQLPAPEKRIVFQLEQTVNSRWFDENYINILKNSYAVLDYSLDNIEFLVKLGISFPHVTYLPIGPLLDKTIENKATLEKEYDVLFYGDSYSSPRRQEMLTVLKSQFNVLEINNCFGEDMLDKISRSRVVINLHYYENALLETTRIMECLSLGIPVVSELTNDVGNYPELSEIVEFFPIGDTNAMCQAVGKVLNSKKEIDIKSFLKESNIQFEFMFDRFLMGSGFLSSNYILNLKNCIPDDSKIIAISLPETIIRRRRFEEVNIDNCFIFNGIRRNPGWIGCGMSYKYIFQYALQYNLDRLTVMEDDVILPIDFKRQYEIINEYLDSLSGHWDLFSGIIASLHSDVEILNVEEYKGITFITINKMTSMVFNVYNNQFMQNLVKWDQNNLDVDYNTIDRFIENMVDLKVIVAFPFLVGHHEEMQSTLWGFKNTQYIDMITESEKKLEKLIEKFKKEKNLI